MHDLRVHIFGRVIDAITDVITAAADNGRLTPQAPARELATMILGALLFERTLLGVQVTTDHLERIVDAALRGWWHS